MNKFKQKRNEASKLETELEKMKIKQALEEDSVPVNRELHKSMETVFAQKESDLAKESELTKLFWEEQKQAFQAKSRGA